MELTETDIARGLGVELEGGKEQEIAEPAETDTGRGDETEGAKEQEAAEPEQEEEEEDSEEEQTPEERKRYAAARRKAEAKFKEKENKLKADYEKKLQTQQDEFIKGLKLKDTWGKPIESKEAFDKNKAEEEKLALDKELRRSGMSREALDKLLAQHPRMRELEQYKAQAEQREAARQQEYIQRRVAEDLAEIKSYDSSINSIGDLDKAMEGNEAFRKAVEGGATLLQAYKEANVDAIAEKKAAQIARSKENSNRGKEHLRPHESRGGKNLRPVPSEIKTQYKKMCPWMSDDEIVRHYNNNTRG